MSEHRLFVGLQPTLPVLGQLRQAGEALQAELAPGGRRVPAEKLHLTLAFLGDFHGEDAVRRALAAGALVDESRIEFELDHAASLGARQPLWVFTGASPPFERLHAGLLRGLHAHGLRPQDEARAFLPHVTWLRNARKRLARTVIAPIAWSAREFVLYDSCRGKYEVLARWPLREPE